MALISFFMFSVAALALNPSAPVVRLDNAGEIVERRQSLPGRYGSTVNYRSAAYRWESDGWRNEKITIVTNIQTVAIPQPIQNVAAAYKAAMEEIYGVGAVTNRSLTRAAVAIDLSLRDDISADTGIRLRTWFEILDEFWGRGEVWTFPYGQTSYNITNVSRVGEVQE
jgi:hypothetical protein